MTMYINNWALIVPKGDGSTIGLIERDIPPRHWLLAWSEVFHMQDEFYGKHFASKHSSDKETWTELSIPNIFPVFPPTMIPSNKRSQTSHGNLYSAPQPNTTTHPTCTSSDTVLIGISLTRGVGGALHNHGIDVTTYTYAGSHIPHIHDILKGISIHYTSPYVWFSSAEGLT